MRQIMDQYGKQESTNSNNPKDYKREGYNKRCIRVLINHGLLI